VTRSSTRTVVTAAAVVEGAHIVWLRAGDLRTHDHPALTAAAAMADRKVLPVFVFDPEECELCTPATVLVIHEAVAELRGTLRDMGSDLAVLIGDPVVELPKLANSVGATTVTAQVCLEWPRLSSYRKTRDALEAVHVRCDEWSASLRQLTDEGVAAAAGAARAARATRGAPLCAHRTEASFVAACGAVAPPLPKPTSLPGIPDAAATKEGEATEEGEVSATRGGGVCADCGGGGGLLGELPSLDTVRSWAGLADNDTDAAYDDAVAAAYVALNDPALTRRRKGVSSVDNAFLMFSGEKMLALAAEEASVAIPVVPFRLPGGESAALDFFGGFLDFYTATSNKEHRRMYDRVLEDKPGAFFRLFGTAMALGTISPRHVVATAREWEVKARRATDLCASAKGIAEARDYQQAVAAAALAAGAEGPGLPLVGAYNVISGAL